VAAITCGKKYRRKEGGLYCKRRPSFIFSRFYVIICQLSDGELFMSYKGESCKVKIRKSESEIMEFKKSTSELKEAVIDICAMLNKHGKGELYFGIKNNGEVCGQLTGFATIRDVSRSITENIRPVVYPEIKVIKKGRMDVI
jgi:hypothetical protein